jgi:hypothetical protein
MAQTKGGQIQKKVDELVGKMPLQLIEALREEFKTEYSAVYSVELERMVAKRNTGDGALSIEEDEFVRVWQKGYSAAIHVVTGAVKQK